MEKVFALFCFLTVAILGSEAATGRATYYHVSAGLTACGTRHSDSELVAAIGWGYWTTPNPNIDPLCLNNQRAIVIDWSTGKNVTVLIRDICGSCEWTGIDLSPAAFQALRPLSDGMMTVEWNYIIS